MSQLDRVDFSIATPATKARVREHMLDTSLAIAKRNIVLKSAHYPRRFIEGIAMSGPEIYKGASLRATGFIYEKEVPLVFGHRETHVIGLVRKMSVRGATVCFVGEVMNAPGVKSRVDVDDLWKQLKCGGSPGVSVSFEPIERAAHDPTVIARWRLRELSLCEALGADPYARLTKVYEKAAVLYLESAKNKPVVFWEGA